MITINGLVDALAGFVTNAVKDYHLNPSKIGTHQTKVPQVVKYFLPPKDPRDKEKIPDFPYIILRPTTGIDDDTLSTLNVRLIIGVYAEDTEGLTDGINILERIRLKLYEQDVLENKYALEKPCHYEIYEQQLQPEWFINLELKFSMYVPFKEIL